MNYQTLLIDGPYLAHRSYSQPWGDNTLIHSFLTSLNALRKRFRPAKILVAWESPGTPSWRRALYPAYKPSSPLDSTYIDELNALQTLLSLFKIPQFYSPSNEADDVLARLALDNNTSNTLIFTVDKDMMQLVDSSTHVCTGKEIFTPVEVLNKFNITPTQIPELLAIMGDNSDNIPGIPGLGPKKTSKLLNEHISLDNIPLDTFTPAQWKLIHLNLRLTKLNDSCPLKNQNIKSKESLDSLLTRFKLDTIRNNLSDYKLLGAQSSLSEFY